MNYNKLFNRNFLLLWQGQTVSQIGSQIFIVVLMFWVKHNTNSATLMGTIMLCSAIPTVLFGPIAGVIVDNFDKKKLIVFSDLINGILVILLSAIIFFKLCPLHLTLIIIFVITFLSGVLKSIFDPAITASIPNLVHKQKLSAANSMHQAIFEIAIFVGQSLAGILYLLFGVPILFLADGLTYLFSAISESFIQFTPNSEIKNRTKYNLKAKLKSDLIEGFRFVNNEPGLRITFFSFALLNFFVSPFIILLPFFVEDVLHLQADWYGYFMGTFGVGAIAGYLIFAQISFSNKTRQRLTIISLLNLSISLLVFGILKIILINMFTVFLVGISYGIFQVNIITILQIIIPENMRGRIFALLNSLVGGLAPISILLSGIVADLLNKNITIIFVFSGLAIFITSIFTITNKEFRYFLLSRNT